ncbi:MAG: aminotransferase class III-fold pyridoxal phosphate-dependent enzyme, partial [Candidatus Nanohaloarchaea archaeon]|nr:aminotransferase class III-fold pyridoxal phosphate-dependent enzyme [Candidatus Nanohaloarchaea archaeon]
MDLDPYRRVLLPTTREEKLITGASGAEVKVDDGSGERWVIDATSQVGTNPLGHRNEEILSAMEELHSRDGEPLMIAGNDFYHAYQRELGETFTEIFPGDQSYGDVKAYYCNSGSEAVERGCLKAAQLYQGGNTYVGFYNAFHGRTSLALSCNFSKAEQTEGFNSLFRALPAPYADRRFDCAECLSRLEETIEREGPSNINAVIVEPIQGEGGYIVPDDDFLPGVRRITREHGVPLVMDEVQASLRTGEWFACQNWDVEPDMISVAKAFSGGVTPFGASLIKDEFATTEHGKHSSTFGGNPQDCFAALKTIEI